MPSRDAHVTPNADFHQAAAHHVRARLARAAQAPWLHGEVARRMAERLPIIRQPPQRWLDWWAHLGAGASAVRAAYPQAQRMAIEPDDLLRAKSGAQLPPWWSRRRWGPQADSVLLQSGVEPAGADM